MVFLALSTPEGEKMASDSKGFITTRYCSRYNGTLMKKSIFSFLLWEVVLGTVLFTALTHSLFKPFKDNS